MPVDTCAFERLPEWKKGGNLNLMILYQTKNLMLLPRISQNAEKWVQLCYTHKKKKTKNDGAKTVNKKIDLKMPPSSKWEHGIYSRSNGL